MQLDLREAPLFRELPAEAVTRLGELAEFRSLRRGTMLFRQGDPVCALYLVTAGRVKLSQVGAQGHEMILRIVGPGEVFAVVAAFEGAQTCPVSAHALTTSHVALWQRAVARSLAQEIPALSVALTREISQHAQSFQQRLREMATENVPQRLGHMLIRLAETAGRVEDAGTLIDFPLTRQDLAQMTGTTLFTVSRLLTSWALKGLVEIGRARVVVCSVDALRTEVESSSSTRPR